MAKTHANMSVPPSHSGIVTDESSGERHIPASVRADGSTRKAIKIRPGYRPPEDVEVYKNRTAENLRARGNGIPGAEGPKSSSVAAPSPDLSAAAAKNAKRREARKKAKAAAAANSRGQRDDEKEEGSGGGGKDGTKKAVDAAAPSTAGTEAYPEMERDKKARNLRKKLKQARELQSQKEGGQALLPEQIAKVIKINELVRELEGLGLSEESGGKTDMVKKKGEGAAR